MGGLTQSRPYLVYVARNEINGKLYVGQTRASFKRRFALHGCDKNSLLGRAIRKYGRENFSHFENEVPEELADNLERNLISLFGSLKPNGYNLDGGGNQYKHITEETRRKLSENHKGHKASQETRLKMSLARKGKPKSVLHRMRIGEANRIALLGHRIPEEQRKRQSEYMKTKPGFMLGRKASPETIQRMTEAQRRRRERERNGRSAE